MLRFAFFAQVVTTLGAGSTALADDAMTAVIVRLADDAASVDFDASSCDAEWSVENVLPRARAEAPPDEALLDSLFTRYVEAEFLACVADGSRVEVEARDALLAGHHGHAGRLLAILAACEFSVENRDRSRAIVETVMVRRLDEPSLWTLTTPAFQAMVDQVRSEVTRRGERTVRLGSDPPGASVTLDGEEGSCPQTPCVLSVRPGEHVVSIHHLGYAPIDRVASMGAEEDLFFTLVESNATLLRDEVEAALARVELRTTEALLRALGGLFGRTVVLLTWRDDATEHAVVYDGTLGEQGLIVAALQREEGASSVIRSAQEQWCRERRGVSPWVWAGSSLAIAAISAVVMYLILRPASVQYEVQF